MRRSLRSSVRFTLLCVTVVAIFCWTAAASAQPAVRIAELAEALGQINPTVIDGPLNDVEDYEPRRMLSTDIRARRQAINQWDVSRWRKIRTREQWEELRDERIAKLKKSLGQFPEPPEDLNVRVTKTIDGDGFQIDCVVFESRPGLHVTANIYSPADIRESMPGILICHSHHNPKTQGELQDMGMTWARQGCVVLIMDQIGHGERRQHPFRTSADYDGEFRVSRQDYYFRYNVGIHLHLMGDSLIGWMAWDLMRGVDLLLGREGVDPERIALLGAVAGGGDPVAVTAAIDPRIKAVVPFNFGGPQPENIFPLPEDAELSFNYIGGGSWESTRNLRVSARDGFLPWVIVGSVAPRRLIYAHEFSWDREKDPVWKRLNSIYDFYDAPDHLASALGYGRVTLSSKEASHCNNIGAYHRKQIHPAFAKWFDIAEPDPEYSKRFDSSQLWCVDGVESDESVDLGNVHKLAGELATQRQREAWKRIGPRERDQRCAAVAELWRDVLGMRPVPVLGGLEPGTSKEHGLRTMRFVMETEPGIYVPVVILFPKKSNSKYPVAIAVAQGGKAGFLKHRAKDIATILENGVAVCLVDVRGTGETAAGDYRGRRSYATGLSSSELMFGGTHLGGQLTDLLCVIQRVRQFSMVNPDRIGVWGDSFAPVNAADRRVDVPLRIDNEPAVCEPAGAALALLAGVFDEKLVIVWSRNGLVSFRNILDSPFVYVPHDFIVPGVLTVGDLPVLGAIIHDSRRSVRIEGLVDGTNRRITVEKAYEEWAIARPRNIIGLSPRAEPRDDFAEDFAATLN